MKNRCYSCMALIADAAPCTSCGYQPGSEPDNSLYLPPSYLLNNRYLVGKVIGVGGFGIVYIAWDNNLDIKVAVKEFLPKEYAARSSNHVSIVPYTGSANNEFALGAEKFLDEAKALARFQDHPGIVKVNESFRANGTAYMIMQYLDGLTLKEYLKKQPGEKMPFTMTVKAMLPIMDALKEVHKAGFVHRDISPDNIFITRQKQIKLLDFGAARYAIGEHSKSLTSVLKHGYAPLEQYSSKGNQGPWSDVYAVAATMYRCITGQTPPDSMERIQEDLINSPKQLGVEISLTAESALMKALSIKAAERFENIQQFQRAVLSGEATSIITSDLRHSDAIEPSRPAAKNVIECPECGAKNQLNHGDDPKTLQCGKCKRELGVVMHVTSPAAPVEAMKNKQMALGAGISLWQRIGAVCAAIGIIIVLIFAFNDSPKEQFDKGKAVFKTDQAAGAKLIIKSADRDYIEAQLLAASLYYKGIGVEKNVPEAVNLWTKAAAAGNSDGMFKLAVCYDLGVGKEKESSDAEKYLIMAADKGHVEASEYLGNMYYLGRGVPQNYVESYKRLMVAANQGSASAQSKIGWQLMNGEGVTKNSFIAFSFLQKAANGDNSFAQRLLGAMYVSGDGVNKDLARGGHWYKKAAANGDKTAQEFLNQFGDILR